MADNLLIINKNYDFFSLKLKRNHVLTRLLPDLYVTFSDIRYLAEISSIWPDTEYKMPNIKPPRYPVHSPMFSTSIVCNNIFRTEHNIFLKPFLTLSC